MSGWTRWLPPAMTTSVEEMLEQLPDNTVAEVNVGDLRLLMKRQQHLLESLRIVKTMAESYKVRLDKAMLTGDRDEILRLQGALQILQQLLAKMKHFNA